MHNKANCFLKEQGEGGGRRKEEGGGGDDLPIFT